MRSAGGARVVVHNFCRCTEGHLNSRQSTQHERYLSGATVMRCQGSLRLISSNARAHCIGRCASGGGAVVISCEAWACLPMSIVQWRVNRGEGPSLNRNFASSAMCG